MCSINTKAQSKRQSTMGPMSIWIKVSQFTLTNNVLEDLQKLRKDCWASGGTWEHELGKCLGQGKRSLNQRDETWSSLFNDTPISIRTMAVLLSKAWAGPCGPVWGRDGMQIHGSTGL